MKRQQEQIDSISRQRASQQLQLEDHVPDAALSQQKSSVGSTQLQEPAAAPPTASYPVDYVTEKTDCELHMSMRNISLKVAVGFAYPNEPEATYHHGVIPAGYARVGVDEVMTGFHTMELEIPGGEEEKTLGDVERGFALWNKKYIVLPDSLPRPPTPPCSSQPQQESPHLPERDPSASPSRSPPRKEEPVKYLRRRRRGSPLRKKPRKDKTPPPLEKLPWEKTDEEIDATVKAHNKAFFAPKVPEIPYVKTLDPVKVARTVDNLYDPVPSPPSDYRRSISRSFDKTMEQAKKGKQIPQLGEQEGQSVPPLKVFDDKAAKAGSLQHIDWNTVLPFGGVAYQYVPGENLVENVSSLSTRMRNLHTWYKKVAKTGNVSVLVAVKEEHYFQEYVVSVEFSKLFQLYNLRALDKSLISCYCL